MSNDEMALEALKWIVNTVEERKNDADKEKDKDDFSDGRSSAYFEMADIIRSRLDVLGISI